jgi:hypothetical protein
MTLVFSGLPLAFQYHLAVLKALSFDSAPPLVKKTAAEEG